MSLSVELNPTSEIEAVNSMLASIGEAPVNSLENSVLPDVAIARLTLKEVSRKVQSRGWHWNREQDFPLASDGNGDVAVPTNTMKLYIDRKRYNGVQYIQRGQRVYDKTNHTYNVGKTILADVVLLLPFTDLNEVARQYIFLQAAHIFQKRTVGAETLFAFTKEDLLEAKVSLIEDESESADYNYFYGEYDNVVSTFDINHFITVS